MKFKPVTVTAGVVYWNTEGTCYAILATERDIKIRARAIDSYWFHIIPFKINIADAGISAFVVRGLMDALLPVRNSLHARDEVVEAARAYLNELCPAGYDEDDAGGLYAQWETDAGRLGQLFSDTVKPRIYTISREDVRRYLTNHADRSESETERRGAERARSAGEADSVDRRGRAIPDDPPGAAGP